MIVGLAIQMDLPITAVVSFLLLVTALAIALYLWTKGRGSTAR